MKKKKSGIRKKNINKAQANQIQTKADFDAALTDSYGMCDLELPVIGHICDRLDYKKPGILGFIEKTILYMLLFSVIWLDIVWDIFVIVTHLGGNIIEAIPVVGPIISTLEEMELDDIVDMYCLIITFICCGPIAALMPALPEFAEGILEFLPWWTISIGVWFVLIRPARRRMLELERKGIIDDEFEWNDDAIQKKSDEELLAESAEIYGIKLDE